MFAPFLSTLRGVAARSSEWASRCGPVALLGYSGGAAGSAARLLTHLYEAPPDSDYYARLTWHETTPIACPPESMALLPVLKCGCMYASSSSNDDDESGRSVASAAGAATPTREDWHAAMYAATSELLEKGYIPVSAGGDGTATLAMVEAYKALHPSEEVVVLHFAASPRLGVCDAPVRVLLDKALPKGVIAVANRCVTVDDRSVRKQYKVQYMDLHAIFAKGIFCIRDLRNDYAVFLSIDANVLDPAFAPAVPVPVPGGLSTRELLHMISGVRAPRVVGVDVHGYYPDLDVCRGDGLGLTQMALTKVLKECVLKAYTVSTRGAQDDGIAHARAVPRAGTMLPNPYANG